MVEMIHYDLPDADVTFFEEFFNKEESDVLFRNLFEKINWRHEKIRMFGKWIDQPRLTAFYGDTDKAYSYSGILMKPDPWNADLLVIKAKIEQQTGIEFTSVLLNCYRDGKDSMGWHADDEKELGKNPVIGSVSFGASRTFQLRHKFEKQIPRQDISLSNGSFLLMKGTTQHYWQHQIPKSSKLMNARINLTFRVIKKNDG